MSTLYMLIGVPGSGKTTWLNQKYDISIGDFIVGSDYIIQEVADQFDISYNEAFPHLIKFAEHMMYKEINNAKMQDANSDFQKALRGDNKPKESSEEVD